MHEYHCFTSQSLVTQVVGLENAGMLTIICLLRQQILDEALQLLLKSVDKEDSAWVQFEKLNVAMPWTLVDTLGDDL
jgi:hypothetical protein